MRNAATVRARPLHRHRTVAALSAAACLVLATGGATLAADDAVSVGLGRYYTTTKGEKAPPAATYVTGEAAGRPAPTNQWYSSVMFQRWSQPIHAHPMTYRASEAGFELGLPSKAYSEVRGGRQREVRYAHAPAITVAPAGFTPQDARLADFSDWHASITMAAGDGASLSVTVLHGSPFSYFENTRGDVRFRLAATPRLVADPRQPGRDPRVLALSLEGSTYAVFAPTGASWDLAKPTEPLLRLPDGARYFSVAGLPDDRDATIADFLAVAYAFPTDTRVEWAYDQKTSTVRTTFRVATVAREGANTATLMGLYPHHWSSMPSAPAWKYQYDSVRGPIRLIPGNSFAVERRYTGFVPRWAGLKDPAHAESVDSLLVGDVAKADQLFTRMGNGTYWYGKGLGALAQLLSVAEAQGQTDKRDKLLAKLKERLEAWFEGKRSQRFVQDARLGTFLGYPQEYDSVTTMNDHHFHYGYWITAAAHVALRDPAWAAPEAWGGMVAKIIGDIANEDRSSREFPFLRNFDAYEGHSWASGTADFDAGNNQESSSEAVNAWAGLIMWGEATGNGRLRDLGAFLYTSEIASVQEYWFDLHRRVLAPEFGKPFASMVFGGKYAYNTWWTEEPRQILGINLLPITPAVTYIGADPAFVRRTIDALPAAVKLYESQGATDGTPRDVWQDVLASYLALADPDAGLAFWDRRGSVEVGETRTRTLYWLYSLQEMGPPDFSVTADTPLYAVFRDKAGERTYLAYNAGPAPLRVTFSTGVSLDVAPRSLARSP